MINSKKLIKYSVTGLASVLLLFSTAMPNVNAKHKSHHYHNHIVRVYHHKSHRRSYRKAHKKNKRTRHYKKHSYRHKRSKGAHKSIHKRAVKHHKKHYRVYIPNMRSEFSEGSPSTYSNPSNINDNNLSQIINKANAIYNE